VAIKVLPADLRDDTTRLARLEREARLLASLNHPHIATLYGLEESGEGTRFLVMELVEGETLAARLRRGAIPLRELYTWGAEMSEALGAAHDHGIVHRDLKPGNVMLTRAGVKLLDFGLAKMTRLTSGSFLDLTEAPPTASTPITSEGTLTGTVLYMAPEQLEGREADARSDIWALGTVLHEMATGRPAFDARTTASVMGAILEREPAKVSETRSVAPRALDHIVATCLIKDPARRRQSAKDLALDLRWLAAEGGMPASLEVEIGMSRARVRRERLFWAGLAAVLAAVAALAWLFAPGTRREATATGPVRFELSIPSYSWNPAETGLALSPRGDAIIYLSAPVPGRQATIWLREFADAEARPIPGTDGAGNLFWSPDGRQVGFVKDNAIRVVDRAGGPVQAVASVPYTTFGPPSWTAGGTIIFSQRGADWEHFEIVQVTADRGDPVQGSKIAGILPTALADDTKVLYIGGEGAVGGEIQLFMGPLDGGAAQRIDGVHSRAEYAAGHLFYWDQGALVARPFDLQGARFTGPPVSLGTMPGASFAPTGMAQFSVARDGEAVAYARTAQSVELRWVDRSGKAVAKLGEGSYGSHRISPDGDRVAVEVFDQSVGTADIDIFDLQRGVPTRLGNGKTPTWSPDGQRLAYGGAAQNETSRTPGGILIRRADGGGTPTQIRTGDIFVLSVDDWSADGKYIIYDAWGQERDVYVVGVNGDQPARLFAGGPGNQMRARFSPDSRWVAFASAELGAMDIFIAPLDNSTAKQRVSVAGGRNPVWSRDGAELYYVNNDTVYAAAFSPGTRKIGTPRALYSLADPIGADLDVLPDGQRFLVPLADRRRSASVITILLDWRDVIRK
jgi:Tol biopolymer transport system component